MYRTNFLYRPSLTALPDYKTISYKQGAPGATGIPEAWGAICTTNVLNENLIQQFQQCVKEACHAAWNASRNRPQKINITMRAGNTTTVVILAEGGKVIDSVTGPSVMIKNGNLTTYVWYKNGKINNPDGPSIVTFDEERLSAESTSAMKKSFFGVSERKLARYRREGRYKRVVAQYVVDDGFTDPQQHLGLKAIEMTFVDVFKTRTEVPLDHEGMFQCRDLRAYHAPTTLTEDPHCHLYRIVTTFVCGYIRYNRLDEVYIGDDSLIVSNEEDTPDYENIRIKFESRHDDSSVPNEQGLRIRGKLDIFQRYPFTNSVDELGYMSKIKQ